MLKNQSQALAAAVQALTLIAAPRRPDGTYNRDRAACEQLARETLRRIDMLTGATEELGTPAVAATPPARGASGIPSSLPSAAQAAGSLTAASGGTPAASPLGHLSANPRRVEGAASYIIYSDGASKGNPGPAGWGAVVQGDGAVRLAEGGFLGDQTNQVAELMAALEGLRRVPERAEVLLVSDSQYVVTGLSQWRKGWERNGWLTADKQPVKNVEIWKALAREADCRRVTTRWVRGHSGDELNERCDQLANEAVAARAPVAQV